MSSKAKKLTFLLRSRAFTKLYWKLLSYRLQITGKAWTRWCRCSICSKCKWWPSKLAYITKTSMCAGTVRHSSKCQWWIWCKSRRRWWTVKWATSLCKTPSILPENKLWTHLLLLKKAWDYLIKTSPSCLKVKFDI